MGYNRGSMKILHHPLINQSKLASLIGVSRSFLDKVKRGKKPLPPDREKQLQEISRELADALTAIDSEPEIE